jgi:hypothetical protein
MSQEPGNHVAAFLAELPIGDPDPLGRLHTTETSEADLLAEGIANDPRPPEVTAKIGTAARECGVPEEVLEALAG